MEMNAVAAEARGVQSIEVGARILEAIAAAGDQVMLRDIALEAGIAPAQAHPYLVSYRRSNLVEQDRESGRYRLGPLALQLGLARLRSFDPLKAAGEAAARFAADTAMSVTITVWGAYGPTVVQIYEGSDQIHTALRPGTVFSLTGSATGRIFCANLGAELVVEAIKLQKAEKSPSRIVGSVSDFRSIRAELAHIREAGYATTTSDPIPGISAMSAPIFETGGELTGAITVIGPVPSFDLAPSAERVREVIDLARAISARAGYQRPGRSA
ncbi:IclR family transcriptional regulator [Sphingobium mellinum]|uniref:IclR family transcriptional regulator n=1 Tax=Sphingobium mellinum TaxID=1387166 RepID=UPI0030ECB356